ncbi:MAG TPA: Cof-type HAD-IIB family hydrolase [Hyphomicrobiaceae bacterium]|nr:Cof-type HAD-IIB family hydrolase [Hyphomicrobiaceae bacterium]
MKISLVIADVDGTLVTSGKTLTPRTLTAVRGLRAAGIAFAITSGRPPRGMAMLIEPLHLTTPIAAFNGGVLVAPDLTPIEEHVLPAPVARSAARIIAEHGADVWVYTDRDWLVRDPGAPHVAREQATVQFAPTVASDLAAALEHAIKIVGVSDDPALLGRCEANVRSALGAQVSAARSQPYYLDVTHPLANKGEVVAALARRLLVPAPAIASIGDMPNDVLMFRRTGLSIAMGNASPEVQSTARHVTASNDKDGFAEAMERYVLARGPR